MTNNLWPNYHDKIFFMSKIILWQKILHMGDTKFLNQWWWKRGAYRQAHQRTGTSKKYIWAFRCSFWPSYINSNASQITKKIKSLKWITLLISFQSVLINNNKKSLKKMDFPLYFKIVILKWPKVFKEIEHGCLRVFGPYF